MLKFFDELDRLYNWFNDTIYKYLLFLYYLGKISKPLYCIFLGLLLTLSLPPFNFFFLLPFVFASIIRLTDFCETKKQAFIIGFWFCFGFYFSSLYWVSFSALKDDDLVWMFPFILFGVPAFLALCNAFIFSTYLWMVTFASAIKKVVLFTCLWVLFEFVRYYVFQFPWNFIGYSASGVLSIAQVVSIFGVLGLSFFLVLWASSYHLLMLTGDKDDFIKYFKFFLFQNILIILFFVFGVIKLHSFSTEPTGTKLRLVQGNVPIAKDIRGWAYDKHLEKYISLTLSKNYEDINYIIWPEGAVESLVYNNEEVKNRLSSLLGPEQYLITGSVRFEGRERLYNSMVIINNKSGIAYYDKNYLVPFGEFVPFRSIFSFSAVANKAQDFSRGNGVQTIRPSTIAPPFTPLICYEVAFSGKIIKNNVEISPKWILNITNDAWYGFSLGPFQHLQIARFRSIEEGLPLVRVSNNGISAVYDSLGKLQVKTTLFTEAVVDVILPKALENITVFSIIGNLPLFLLLIFYIIYNILEFLYLKYDKKINQIGYSVASRREKPKKHK